jgi:hypothetical protein
MTMMWAIERWGLGRCFEIQMIAMCKSTTTVIPARAGMTVIRTNSLACVGRQSSFPHKLLHKLHQQIHTRLWHRIINTRPHSTRQPMSFQINHALLTRVR